MAVEGVRDGRGISTRLALRVATALAEVVPVHPSSSRPSSPSPSSSKPATGLAPVIPLVGVALVSLWERAGDGDDKRR